MFKKLVKMVSEIKTENDRDATFWQIDREFEQGKISAADHELLYKLAGMVEIEEDFYPRPPRGGRPVTGLV